MISFIGMIERALKGPFSSEEDFDLNVFVPKLREVIKKYEIKYDPENPIPSDNDLADRIFQAGLEFYANVGTYCTDTQRIIKFTRAEIEEALVTAPSAPVFGEGKDAKALVARRPESDTPPWCFLGATGAIVSCGEIFLSLLEGYGLNPLADSITIPTLTTLNGVQIRADSPLEILSGITTVTLAREGLRRAGRPGLSIMNCVSVGSDAAKIAGSQFGLRPSDGWLIASVSEMKVNFERLNEIAYVKSLGGHVNAVSSPMLGGFCGGPEGAAVASVAYHIQSILVFRGSCHDSSILHFKYSCNTGRDVLWATSMTNQAISRNSHFPLLTCTVIASGPMTEMHFYENAAQVITATVSGGSTEAGSAAKNVLMDHVTPMEPLFASEVAHAVVGMKRNEANEIVNRLLRKYENDLDDPPKGKKFQECYNIGTLEPSREYTELYRKMKNELSDYGLKFKY